jgi:hypothetical protein
MDNIQQRKLKLADMTIELVENKRKIDKLKKESGPQMTDLMFASRKADELFQNIMAEVAAIESLRG